MTEQFDSRIVILIQAGITFQQSDGELWGVLVVKRKDGPTRQFGQFLPCAAVPEPPGWRTIEELTGVTAAQAVDGWNDQGTHNAVAERAFKLMGEHIGCEFLAKEIEGVSGFAAVELVPLRIDDPGILPDDDELPTFFTEEPPNTTELTSVTPSIDLQDQNPPGFTLVTTGAPPLTIEAPDIDHNPDPAAYWLVELLTEIPASALAHSWVEVTVGKESATFTRAVAQLERCLTDVDIPLRPDGTLDLDLLRKNLIRARYRQGCKPKFFVGRPLEIMAKRSWTLMQDCIGPHFFRYNVERGASSGIPAVIRMVDGQAKLEVLDDEDKLRAVASNCIHYVRAGKRNTISHINPPQACLTHMLTLADQSVNPIDTLTRIPTTRKDGSIHDQEGYDRRSRIWYAPEMFIKDVPADPTEADVQQAVATVLTPFKEFPYIEDAGARTAVIACLMEQVVRPMIDGPRPLYAFDAPAFRGQGTGKTLLPMAIGAIITGKRVGVTTWPEDPKELPKTITTKLLEADPFVIFDNLEGTVRHKDLAALTTSQTWSNRLLHSNMAPKLAQTTSWCLTLNGARFSRDIARRAILIRLDARTADPHKRKGFVIDNLIPWCIQRRASIIRAVLIMARAWVVAGSKPDPRLTWGSFEAWAGVVGGILHHAGLTDLPTAIEQSHLRDVDTIEHETFIKHWREVLPDQHVTALMLAELAEKHQLYATLLERARTPNWKGRQMATVLRNLAGHSFDGWLVQTSDHRVNGQVQYRIASPTGLVGVN